jgi:molybdopterin molybdotransferase
VVFEVMVRPLIRIALGRRHPMRRIVRARSIMPVSSMAGRRGYLRAQLMRDEQTGDYLVQPLGVNGSSHLLSTLAEANGLIVLEPDVTEVRTGDEVKVAFLAQRG